MTRYFAAVAAAILVCTGVFAQNNVPEEGEGGEELVFVNPEVQVDSTLEGQGIFEIMPSTVKVFQSEKIRKALASQVESNNKKQYTGYRIRIFFDSGKDAREKSRAVLEAFKVNHPEMTAFLTYDEPNFKVTAGNFRNRTDADIVLETLKEEYPSAFVVREKFKYPSIGLYTKVDTLSVKAL